jgi:murein DD-endopeptidase MepM/ murein hydrolase activator NlpD
VTRFGRWFAGAVLLVVALFVVGLLMPGSRQVLQKQVAAPRTAAPSTAAQPPAEPTPSGLTIPVANVRAADLTDTFGDPRGTDGERGHGALDIPAPRGTPVLAAAGGTIEKIFESELGGHTIYVRSPDRRFVYYYAHLDAYAPEAREGVYVAQGEQIGTVGSTGDADPAGPHLHFEIKRMQPGQPWYEGAGIDPYPLLAGKPVLAGGGTGG